MRCLAPRAKTPITDHSAVIRFTPSGSRLILSYPPPDHTTQLHLAFLDAPAEFVKFDIPTRRLAKIFGVRSRQRSHPKESITLTYKHDIRHHARNIHSHYRVRFPGGLSDWASAARVFCRPDQLFVIVTSTITVVC
jgi:hypothetical protein